MEKVNYVILIFMVVFLLMLQGCKDKYKLLVSSHSNVGELLITVKDKTTQLHEQHVINDDTYNQIRINWVRAQKSYTEASLLLEILLEAELPDTVDMSNYYELITQVSIIVSDIALWLEEDK